MTDSLPHVDLGAAWRKARPRPAGRHLDSAACSRQSTRALDAAAHHARHEAELGGYVAEAASDDLLQQGRSVLGGLVGMAAADVAFVESAQAALVALLTGWRLPAGSRVACLRGSTRQRRPAAPPGLRPEPLPVDGARPGRPRRYRAAAPRRPAGLVHLTHIGSHRGLLQPAAEVAALCRAAGVPLVLDAGAVARARGRRPRGRRRLRHLPQVADRPARRGVLFVRPRLAAQLTPVLPEPEGVPPMRAFESGRGARRGPGRPRRGRRGPPRRRPGPGAGTAAALGRATRELLDGVGGWRVIEPVDEPTATTTLRPPDGVDVVETRTRLLVEHGIVTSAIGRERAPGEMTGPVLRVSPHLDATVDDLEALAAAL